MPDRHSRGLTVKQQSFVTGYATRKLIRVLESYLPFEALHDTWSNYRQAENRIVGVLRSLLKKC